MKGEREVSISGKNKLKEQSAVRSVLYGILIAILMLLLGSAIVAALIYKGNVNETSASALASILVFISVLDGGSIAAKLRKKKAAVISAITTAGIVLILVATNIIFFDAKFEGTITILIAALLGWIVASLVGAEKKKKR